ncbi:MAG TPA: NapC/NirT family cytochrome c [Candidatus Aquicultor sp.]|jgi:hypothetical protein
MRKFDFDAIKSRILASRIKLPDMSNPRTRILVIAAGAVALILVAAFGYGYWFAAQPTFCQNCHELQADYRSWKTSIHAEVDCGTCHYTGPFGFAKQKVALANDTVKHLTGSFSQPLNIDSALSRQIDDDGCLQCHTPKRVITPRKTLVMNHQIHMDKGINCTTCHNRVGHGDSQGYQNFISMEGCFRCHGLSKTAVAPGKCSLCHPKTFDLVPVSHKTGTWLVPDHGKTAAQSTATCAVCHQKAFCRGCHGVDVPHPDKFIKDDHSTIGKSNPRICKKCHRQQDFCNACHHKGYTGPPGGWIPTHRTVVTQTGPAYCFGCHGPTYCAKCHVASQ